MRTYKILHREKKGREHEAYFGRIFKAGILRGKDQGRDAL